ncbi:MAG: choice-of-anchor A family protein [bacterium]
MKFVILFLIHVVSIPGLLAQIDPIVFQSGIFSAGNITGTAINAEDVLLAGGSQSLRAVNVTDLYAVGNISLISANVNGELALGGTLSQKASRVNSIHFFLEPKYNFQQIQNGLVELSTELSQRLSNGTLQRIDFNHVRLVGNDPVLNIFDAGDFYFNDQVEFDVPPASIAILNMKGRSPNFSMITFNRPSAGYLGIDPGRVLVNFPGVTSLSVDYSQIGGTLLAPSARLNLQATSVYGTAIGAGIVATGANFYDRPFVGVEQRVVSEPVSEVGLLVGGMMAIVSLRIGMDRGGL